MRINIYNEEITDDFEITTREVDNGKIFYGLRLFMASSSVLHNSIDDNDVTAVTFWFDSLEKLRTKLVALATAVAR